MDRESVFEDILRDSESVCVVLTDTGDNVLYWNSGAARIFGYTAEEAAGKNLVHLLESDAEEYNVSVIEQARAYIRDNKQGTSYEVQQREKGGQKVWINWNAMPRLDDKGNVAGTLFIGENVSGRKIAENHLEYTNERYRALVTLLPDIVFMVDADGKFVFVNDSISMLGYAPEELVGLHYKIIIHPDDYPGISREHVLPRYIGKMTGPGNAPKLFDERRSGNRKTTNLEVRLVPKKDSDESGERVAIVSTVNASGFYNVKDNENKFMGTIGVIRDITERKIAEEERIRLEKQLQQARKMEAIGQLAGGIAHDFNNMLSGISGYAEVIKQKNRLKDGTIKDAALDSHIDVIIKAAERAGDLTMKLLAFSRQGKYQIVPVNIHQTVNDVMSLLKHTIDRRIQINTLLDAGRPVVMGDPAQLENAVLNLAVNGCDAMPEGGTLSFATRVSDIDDFQVRSKPYHMETGRYIVLDISDTGVGMDEAVRQHMFEPFFTTKEVGKGTGLGLASVYGTVKSHHGAIEVETAPGKGTRFSVFLPMHEELEVEPLPSEHTIVQGSGQIMVVDDEEMVRNILSKMLGDIGYTVVSCANGREAVSYYQKHAGEIDCVILDMNMPVMNGAECFEKLKQINNDIKVIITTGYHVQAETQILINRHASGFIQKPFKLANLSEEVGRVLGDKSRG